jgi:hypothetical protein
MKRKIILGVVVVLVAYVAYSFYSGYQASKLSPRGNSSYSYQGVDMKVDYGRPYKKGRLIFGEEADKVLQPNGKYWRLGANAATEITFSKNVNFAGQPLNAGTYRMYAVPNASSWQVALNSETGVYFGFREPDYTLDVLKVEVPVGVAPSETEQFVINFSNDSTTVNMDFVWDKTMVRVPITIQ